MIVVEGCDGTGKTTLVRSLCDDLNLRTGVRGTSNRDELYKVTREDTYKALAHSVEGFHPPYVWDRLGPISDPIYSAIMGRDCAFNLMELDFFKRVVNAIKCPIIICHVPLSVAEENQEKAHQMAGVDDNYHYLHNAYTAVKESLEDWGPHVHAYDYRVEGSYDELKSKLQTYLARRKEREWH